MRRKTRLSCRARHVQRAPQASLESLIEKHLSLLDVLVDVAHAKLDGFHRSPSTFRSRSKDGQLLISFPRQTSALSERLTHPGFGFRFGYC